MNQSRPRELWREGAAVVWSVTGSDTCDATPMLPIGCPRRPPSIRSIEWDEPASGMFVRLLQGSNCSGFRLPDAPNTTIGVSSLYSGAAVT